jgi:hypothetical protein
MPSVSNTAGITDHTAAGGRDTTLSRTEEATFVKPPLTCVPPSKPVLLGTMGGAVGPAEVVPPPDAHALARTQTTRSKHFA